MDINILGSPEYLDSEGAKVLQALHIRSVESFVSRAGNQNALELLSDRLEMDQQQLRRIVDKAHKQLIPNFDPDQAGPPVSKGALSPQT